MDKLEDVLVRLVQRGIEAATDKMVDIAFDPRSAGAQIEGMKAGESFQNWRRTQEKWRSRRSSGWRN